MCNRTISIPEIASHLNFARRRGVHEAQRRISTQHWQPLSAFIFLVVYSHHKTFFSIPKSCTMNHEQWRDQSRGYGSAHGNPIPWEIGINSGAEYPMSEIKSHTTSPSTLPEGVSKYPTPNPLEITEDDPSTFHGTANHRGCGYTFSSWLPELLGCTLGMLALTGQTNPPQRILAG